MCGYTHASGDKESISGIQNTKGCQGCMFKIAKLLRMGN